MPYELTFSKVVPIRDREDYINECCVGGDAVVDYLLPFVKGAYEDIDSNQEDWGWFIWFCKGEIRLAIDVFTDDPDAGLFRVHLTSRKRRLLGSTILDTTELQELCDLVTSAIQTWTGQRVQIERLDSRYR
jgi:hypothetical protein